MSKLNRENQGQTRNDNAELIKLMQSAKQDETVFELLDKLGQGLTYDHEGGPLIYRQDRPQDNLVMVNYALNK